ncbi:MAG: phosphoribosylglycinamide formyltransferase [Acidobacteriota bacterium]
MSEDFKKVAILLSGRGSNFVALSEAIEKGEIPARIVLVFSNRPDAQGLEKARQKECPTACIPPEGRGRESYDRLVVEALQKAGAEVICLAGYMRILSPVLVRAFPERILNIHPSLLPSFTGLHAQRQALQWGARVSGCTVHLVDEELDHGPIILQHPVPVLDGDTEESLSERILVHEHEIYPQALRIVCQGRYRIEGRRVIVEQKESGIRSQESGRRGIE